MAYETKVILMSLANQVALANTTKQAFEMIRSAAQVEGLSIPDYEKIRAKFMNDDRMNDEPSDISGNDAPRGHTGSHLEHRS